MCTIANKARTKHDSSYQCHQVACYTWSRTSAVEIPTRVHQNDMRDGKRVRGWTEGILEGVLEEFYNPLGVIVVWSFL